MNHESAKILRFLIPVLIFHKGAFSETLAKCAPKWHIKKKNAFYKHVQDLILQLWKSLFFQIVNFTAAYTAYIVGTAKRR